MRPRVLRPLTALVTALPLALHAQGKPTLAPKDYARWEGLGPAQLAPDGKWLAYAITRVSEDNELRLRPVGRDSTIVVANASAPVFAATSRWLAYAIDPSPAEREKLEKEKKPVRRSVGFRDLGGGGGTATTVADVTSFRFSADGRFLAMRRYPAEGKRASELLVQDLGKGTRLTFGNVSDFAWSESGALLAITLETEGGSGNAVELFDAGSGALKVLDASPSLYRAPSWRRGGDDLAVLRTVVEKGYRDTAHVVLAWRHVGGASPERLELSAATAGFPGGTRVAEHRRPEWARDGSALFVGLRPRVAAADSAAKGNGAGGKEKVSDVQVWHARDVRIMPMQKVQEQQDLQRTLLAAWRVGDASPRLIPIATVLLETTRLLEGGRVATESDRAPYPFGAMFGRPAQDVYVIDTRTGERKRALEKVRYFFGGSATGRRLLWFDGKDYWTYDLATGARTNLTARLTAAGADFTDQEFDYPHDFLPPDGVAGWTRGDGAVLVYDHYDVWSLAPDGSGGRRLTNGAADSVIHRYARTRADSEGIDLSKPLYLSLAGERSKKTGYAVLRPRAAAPERLVFDDARVARLVRADSAEVFAFTRERFDDSPDWFVGGAALRDAAQASATNPFQRDFAWGRGEVMDFTSAAGRPLQAALYYPANYEPGRKYPMIVYTYERLSQGVHNYVVPSERNYYDAAVFTQEGYFVLMPDIVFRDRDPGISVLEAVVPAVHAVVRRGLVDSARVGHVGHSWGGYEATFLPTRTGIFAASVAGAPITNFLSFAGAIHWTPGIAEFDHWETGQARMGVPPWEDLEAYLRNSPIAKVQDLKTPLLMEVGDADGTVDWHQGIEFYNFARRAGNKDFVLLVYPGEDHGLRKKENQIDYHRRILQWFGHYLKGEPAARWMTEGQGWLDRKAALDAAMSGGGPM